MRQHNRRDRPPNRNGLGAGSFKRLLETSTEAVWIADEDGVLSEVNPAMCAILERTREEVIGCKIFDYIDRESHDVLRTVLTAAGRGQYGACHIIVHSKTNKTSTVSVDVDVNSNSNTGGIEIIGFCTLQALAKPQANVESPFAQNDSETVRQQLKVMRQHAGLLLALLDASPSRIYARDCGGKFLWVNKAWEKAHQSTRAQAIGKTVDDFIPAHRAEIYKAQDEEVLNSSAPIDTEVELSFGEDVRILHIIKFPLFSDDNELLGVGGMTSDLTNRRQLEARLQQTQKMEMLGLLTGGVAHDFNNLLAIIHGNADIIAELSNEAAPMANVILRAASRGSELTKRMLAFSRQQPLRPEAVDLGELINGMADMLNLTIGDSISLEINIPDNLLSAHVDAAQIESALLNMAINSRDAMTNGGTFTISCENIHSTSPELRTFRKAGKVDTGNVTRYIAIRVRDTGTGMAQEVRAQAFDPFFTTKTDGRGSGLGLSSVYGFAEQSGGYVTLESEPDVGTIVHLYLPAIQNVETLKDADEGDLLPLGHGERILVIDDDSDICDFLAYLLRNFGYRVVTANNARQAENQLVGCNWDVDLVLSDVVLPGGTSGPDFAADVQERHPNLRFIFMSGYPADYSIQVAELNPDGPLLRKPFERSELMKVLRSALSKR